MMKRRDFLKKATLTTAGTITLPYILPTGRLFASTGSQMAGHVVFVMFAGGVRQQEAMGKRYLADSQGLDIEGNIMYNMLTGDVPELKVVYGVDSSDGQPGGQPIDKILNTSLEEQGTLFKEVRYTNGATAHFGGLSTGISGYYGVTQGLQTRPLHPTIFEYLRRHAGFKATDTWFIGNSINNSTPLLNHSAHPDYGRKYAANFFAPNVTFGQQGEDHLKGFRNFHPDEEMSRIVEMREFLNHAYLANGREIPHLYNTEEERYFIKQFIENTFDQKEGNQIAFPPVIDNGDLSTIGYVTEVLKWFKPKISAIVGTTSAAFPTGLFSSPTMRFASTPGPTI